MNEKIVSSNHSQTHKKSPEVKKDHPCVICGKPDWCYTLSDGLLVCKRTTHKNNLPNGYKWTEKVDKDGYYYIGTEDSQLKWKKQNKGRNYKRSLKAKADYTYYYPCYTKDDNELYQPKSGFSLVVKRWDATPGIGDEKEFIQSSLVNGKYQSGTSAIKDLLAGFYCSRSSFDHQEISPKKILLVCEGEKVVDVFNPITHTDRKILMSFVALTNANGASKWSEEHTKFLIQPIMYPDGEYNPDWKETANLILLVCDWDKPGIKRIVDIYKQLSSLEYPQDKIKVVTGHISNLNVLPASKGRDMVDWIDENGFSFESVQEFLDRMTISIDKIPYEELLGTNREKSEGRYQIRIAKETIESKGIDTSINWLVDSLLAANSSTLLVAQEKTGKTCLMLDMLAAIHTGKEFLGKATKQSKVLFINTDSSEATFLKQVNDRWGNSEELDNQLPYVQDWIADETGLQFLEDYCKANSGSVIVIDSIKGLSYPLDIDENTPAIGKIVKEISSKICTNGCTVVFLHHVSKAKGKYRTHKGTGHHSISSNVDQILLLEDLPNNKNEVRRLSSLGSRFTRKFSIDYLPTDDYRCEVTFQANTNDDEEDDNDSIKGQLLTYLADKNDWVTRKEILDELGTEDKYLSRILKQVGREVEVKPDPSDSRKKLYKIGGQKKVSSPDSPTYTKDTYLDTYLPKPVSERVSEIGGQIGIHDEGEKDTKKDTYFEEVEDTYFEDED
jgi:hypothetical protein